MAVGKVRTAWNREVLIFEGDAATEYMAVGKRRTAPRFDPGAMRRWGSSSMMMPCESMEACRVVPGAPSHLHRTDACYFTDVPILDAGVARHAEAVRQCDGLVFVYSSIASSLPPAMKGWLDRVLVPGVSFVMEDGKLRGGLGHVRVLAGIAVHGESRATIRRHRDLGRRMLMRSLRSCAPKRLRTAWLALYEPELDDTKRFAGEVERTIGRLVR